MRFGMVTLSLSMILVGATAEAQRQLRVESMTSNNCRVVDHNGTTGDDSGGIAVSGQKVYYNGDSAAGEFNLNDLGGQRRVSGSARYSMISNLADGKLYALWNSQANQPVSTRTSTPRRRRSRCRSRLICRVRTRAPVTCCWRAMTRWAWVPTTVAGTSSALKTDR